MTREALILDATGKIVGHAVDALLANGSGGLLLFTRHSQNVSVADENRETVIEGDVLNIGDLEPVIERADVVYADLWNPEITQQAKDIVSLMGKYAVKSLAWVSPAGTYGEVPGKFGEWNNRVLGGSQKDSYLETYRSAVDVIENSTLDYTIIQPAWLTDRDEADYEATAKGEPFKGTEVSRKSADNFVAKIIDDPTPYARKNFGMNKPNTDGDKPAWYQSQCKVFIG